MSYYKGLEQKSPKIRRQHPCPRCETYGMRIMRRDAYAGLPGQPLTRHFIETCPDCLGHGYLEKAATCEHSWKAQGMLDFARQERIVVCDRCDERRVYDTSG